MAKENNTLLILGIILLISPFAYSYFTGNGATGGLGQSVYSIKCDVRVSNPIIGTADIDSATCVKSKKLFCGSPLSLSVISSNYNIKLTAGSSSKEEHFDLFATTDKLVSTTVCTKEDVGQVKIELFNKDDLKDTENANV